MRVEEPPGSARFWFRAVGKRVEPRYRPWVAQELAHPRFHRRRMPASLAVPVGLVIVPQGLIALAGHSVLRMIPVAVMTVCLAGGVVFNWNRGLPDGARARALAYQGATADGRAVAPAPFWTTSPIGKAGLAVFAAQILVFSTGVAVAATTITLRRGCLSASAADVAAVAADVGRPLPPQAAGFGPAPVVPPGSPLRYAREVRTPFRGTRYFAAYVRGPSGRLLGPATWRVIDPDATLNPGHGVYVGAQDPLARTITPGIGYGGTQPADPGPGQARDCARAAR